MYGNHLEGDTRVVFHAKNADTTDPGNIAVRANNIGIAVILIYNIHHVDSDVWYDSGHNYDNSRECINIKKLVSNVQNVSSLPGLYAFLGNNYTPAFFGKEKVKPIQIVIKKEKFANVFSKLGEREMSHEVFSTIEEYVCSVYGFKCDKNVNDLIRKMSEERSKPKSTERPLDCIKSLDPNKFPPCRAVLKQHIKRHGLLQNYTKQHIWHTQYLQIMAGSSRNLAVI